MFVRPTQLTVIGVGATSSSSEDIADSSKPSLSRPRLSGSRQSLSSSRQSLHGSRSQLSQSITEKSNQPSLDAAPTMSKPSRKSMLLQPSSRSSTEQPGIPENSAPTTSKRSSFVETEYFNSRKMGEVALSCSMRISVQIFFKNF
uniref:Uncharacterized protein n=1 Tax=Megaselia scalaris TaxID=36166 RepID=T1H120_MEGSC